jgi:hypothetical protein
MNAETNPSEETMNLTPMMTQPPTSEKPDPKSSSSSVRKEGRVSREEQEREEQRNRVRRFLQETHRDKLYFPLEDVPQGVEYRWIREECRGVTDLSRISLMTKKGWTPVPFDRHPTFLADTLWNASPQSSKPDVIRIDGLILCERPLEFGQMEKEALEAQNAQALKSVKWAADNIEVKDRKTFIHKTSHEGEVF